MEEKGVAAASIGTAAVAADSRLLQESTEARPIVARLFLALPIGTNLAPATEPATRVAGFRAVPAGSWHVTLAFFANVDASAVVDAVGQIDAPAMDAIWTTPGAFPGPARANAVWLGLDHPELSAFVRELRRRVGDLNADIKGFQAHVTLGRFNVPKDVRILLRRIIPPKGTTTLDRLDLMESELTPDGPIHRIVHSWPLS